MSTNKQPESTASNITDLEKLAVFLDNRFIVPGTNIRFGFDALLGLIPVLGDILSAAISCYLIFRAWQLGVPAYVLFKMVINIGLDFLIGAVPLFGDLLDIAFRANFKNLDLIKQHLSNAEA